MLVSYKKERVIFTKSSLLANFCVQMGPTVSSTKSTPTTAIVVQTAQETRNRRLHAARCLAQLMRLHELPAKDLVEVNKYMGGNAKQKRKPLLLRELYRLFQVEVEYGYGIKYLDYPLEPLMSFTSQQAKEKPNKRQHVDEKNPCEEVN